MTRRLALGLLVATALVAPARADDASATILDRAAELILQTTPPVDDADWAMRWDAVSIRTASGPVRWHLAGPDRPDAAYVARSGWLAADGRQIGVQACGTAEAVTELSLLIPSETGPAPLIDVMRARGAAVTVRPDGASFDIAAPGRAPAVLRGTVICTPPGSRAARRCATDVLIRFTADATAPACGDRAPN